jgi:flagellar biosynthetic protein FliQ
MGQGDVRQALWTGCLVGLPILILSLVIGVAISVFQAMTSIQEQTLSFVPKIIAVVLALVVLGPWMLGTMVSFTTNLFRTLPQMIR